ncbi:MAG: YdeI/OmpD-associated family protein [Acidimicrobiales bacterium]
MPPARRDDPSAPVVHGKSPSIPATASDHPACWKFDFPIYHPADLAAWRAWLATNCDTVRGVWVVSWRKASGRDPVAYENLVEEAICFGWIDSTVNILDDARGLQLMTPRKPRSGWTRLNRQRVAALEAQGRMTDAGRRAVEVAKANGSWTIYDSVEDLLEPDDLADALDACPAARTAWDGFPPSARKQMLWWVVSSGRPQTRASRIAKIVSEAASGRRAQG